MIDEIIASGDGAAMQIALRENGRLVELLTADGDEPGAVGDIILGRVTSIMKSMDACFVDIGAERAGFLPLAGRGGGAASIQVSRAGRGGGGAASIQVSGAGRGGGVAASIQVSRAGRGDARAPAQPIHDGATVLVQVAKAAQAGKGAGLTRNIAIAGRYLVLTPFQEGVRVSRRLGDEAQRARLEAELARLIEGDEGFILRTAAGGVGAEALAADARNLHALWRDIVAEMEGREAPCRLHGEGSALARALRDRAHEGLRRIVVDDAGAAAEAREFCAEYLPHLAGRVELWDEADPLFEALGIEDDIDDALEPVVDLACGGTLVIEETAALTAIDVNTARNTARSGHAATARATNLEAAGEIVRQLRLRGLGGLSVIDFVHMDDDEDQGAVLAALAAALADDPGFVRMTGFSDLGLVELARRRGAGPLAERLGVGDEDGDGDGAA